MFKRRRVKVFNRRGFPALRKPLEHEELIQASFVSVLEMAKPKGFWFHVPNGGKRKLSVAKVLKLLGTRPGVFDFVFLLPGARTLWIEFKYGDNNLRKSQKEFEVYLKLYGFPYAVCWSVEEALRFLLEQGVAFDHPAIVSQFLQNPSTPPKLDSGPGSPLSSNRLGLGSSPLA
jgi:hypothetical protein